MVDAVRFIGRDRHGDYVFALPDGTYCSSPGDAGGVAAATEITAASYEEGRIVGRAPSAYLQQDGPIFGPDGILLEADRKIPLFVTYDLPADADHIMDEPTEEDRAAAKNWAGNFVAGQSRETYRRWLAQRDEYVQRLLAQDMDRMAQGMRQYEEPLRRKVAEREERYRIAWEHVFDRIPAMMGDQGLVEQPERDQVSRMAKALADTAVRKTGTGGITQEEIRPGYHRISVETDGMIYEIEVRGGRR